MVEWSHKWKGGLGQIGEQRAESIHSYFNDLKAKYDSIPDRVKRLKHNYFYDVSPPTP